MQGVKFVCNFKTNIFWLLNWSKCLPYKEVFLLQVAPGRLHVALHMHTKPVFWWMVWNSSHVFNRRRKEKCRFFSDEVTGRNQLKKYIYVVEAIQGTDVYYSFLFWRCYFAISGNVLFSIGACTQQRTHWKKDALVGTRI